MNNGQYPRYRIAMNLLDEDMGGCWWAHYPTLGEYTVYGMGATEEEAIINLRKSRDEMFAYWNENGIEIPQPTNEDLGLMSISFEIDAMDSANNNYAFAA